MLLQPPVVNIHAHTHGGAVELVATASRYLLFSFPLTYFCLGIYYFVIILSLTDCYYYCCCCARAFVAVCPIIEICVWWIDDCCCWQIVPHRTTAVVKCPFFVYWNAQKGGRQWIDVRVLVIIESVSRSVGHWLVATTRHDSARQQEKKTKTKLARAFRKTRSYFTLERGAVIWHWMVGRRYVLTHSRGSA